MSCCGRFRASQVTPCLHVGNSFWECDADINSETENEYRKAVMKNLENLDEMRNEAANVVYCNYANRTKVVCECLISGVEAVVSWNDLITPETGTSLLHFALLSESNDVAKILIEAGGRNMIMQQVQSGYFTGTTALHVAVVNGNIEIVKTILSKLEQDDKKELINCQVKTGINMQGHDLTGCTLALAIWGGNADLFDLLVENGAEIDEQDDKTGSGILHTVIMKNKNIPGDDVELCEHILNSDTTLKWWAEKRNIDSEKCGLQEKMKMKRHLLSMKNFDGYTPLTYATLLGTQNLITAILQTEMVYKFKNWKYGGVTEAFYNVGEIEPTCVKVSEPSMIDLLAFAHEGDHMDILTQEPIKTVVEEKWKSASKLYILWGIYHTLTMVILTTVAMYRETRTDDTEDDLSFGDLHKNSRMWVFVGESISASTAFFYFVSLSFQSLRVVYTVFKSRIWRDPTFYKAPWPVLFTLDLFWIVMQVFSIATLVYYLLHISRRGEEEPPLCVALIFGWYFMLYFTRGFKATGFFTVMIHRMLFGDLIRFGLVIAIYILAFGSAFVVLFQGPPSGVPDEAKSLEESLFAHFKLLLGLSDINVLNESSDHILAYIVYICFVVLATLELLNMLIAAMSDTYAAVSENRINVWQHERLKCILMMERNMPSTLWRTLVKVSIHYSEKYDAPLLTVHETECHRTGDNNLL